jgi:tRNA(Ile)-lysidine synthase
MNDFESAVAAALRNCPPGTVYLAAVSGGADSTAMLAALAASRFPVRCLHVEHGIRGAEESRGDADFVRSLCEGFGFPCTVVSIAPGKIAGTARRRNSGIEAAARFYRRRALFREGRRIEAETGAPVRILTAHTRDDALETALMRILRGAGPAGLAAMPPNRGRILRPLLSLDRAGVLRYLQDRNLSWREDSTNADTRFLRNRIRHSLVPLLRENFPQWRTGLAAFAETQSLAAAYIAGEARRRVLWAHEGGFLCTGAETFFAQSAIIREEALFLGIGIYLKSLGRKNNSIRRASIRRFCAGLVKAADLGVLRVRRAGDKVIIAPQKSGPRETGFSLLIPAEGVYTLRAASNEGMLIRGEGYIPRGSAARLLIKGPGFYTLRRTRFEVKPCSGEEVPPADGFFALLPLVLRPCFSGDSLGGKKAADLANSRERRRMISAVDSLGVAAFIDSGGLVLGREPPAAGIQDFYRVRLFHV